MNTTIKLAEGGRSAYTIVIADDAPAPVRTAARELRDTVHAMSGATLAVAEDTASPGAHEIVLGPSPRLAQIAPDIRPDALGPEEYLIRTAGSRPVIVGGKPRGTLYGVYAFLRDHLGCRWFAPDCAHIPARDVVKVGRIDARQSPAFEYRNFILDGVDDPAWCARNAFNGFNSPDDPAHGGHTTHWQYGHSLFALCRAEDYFEEHPEYFDSTSRQKAVIDDYINLCFTNEDVVRIVADNMRAVMAEAVEKQHADPDVTQPTVFYLAQHDGGTTCTCPDCQSIIDAEGALSAPLIHFCNRVVDEIGDEFPDFRMITIAYRFSRRPPRTLRPHPKLIVQLCSIECCQSHPYATCDDPDDVLFRQDLEGWRSLTDNMWIWDYMPRLWHPFLVGPGFDSMAANYRWFHEHGVRGMFTQTGGERDFKWMNAYLMCEMMRDPHQDWTALRDAFMDAYYGAAAAPLREFLAVVQRSVVEGNHHLHYKEGTVKPFFSERVIREGDRFFAAAQDAVRTMPAQSARVREERMHFLCTKLQHACRDSVLNGCRTDDGRYAFTRSGTMQREVSEFSAWKTERFSATGAGQAYTRTRGGSSMLDVESDLVTLDNGDLELEFVPRLAGRMVSCRHKAAGHNFLHVAPCEGGHFNLANGYREEWLAAPCVYEQESTSGWSADEGRGVGAAEGGTDASVADQTATHTRVFETGGKFVHPMQWERWTRLVDSGGSFSIESQIVNRGIHTENSAVETCLPLYLGAVADVGVTVGGGGTPLERRPYSGPGATPPSSGSSPELSASLELTPQQAADGITLANPRLGLALRWRATGEVIRSVRMDFDVDSDRVTLRIETEPVMLHAGSGRRFCQYIDVLTGKEAREST